MADWAIEAGQGAFAPRAAQKSAKALQSAEAPRMEERISDADLVTRAEAGDPAAFNELVDRYFDIAISAAYKVLMDPEAARDCAQEAFLEATANLGTLREKNRFSGWIYGIAYRKAIAVVRRSKLHVAAMEHKKDESRSVIPLGTPLEQAETKEKNKSILAALHEIPEIYREVIILKYIDGRSHQDIAQILDLTHAAVDKRLTRGKDLLRESLGRWRTE